MLNISVIKSCFPSTLGPSIALLFFCFTLLIKQNVCTFRCNKVISWVCCGYINCSCQAAVTLLRISGSSLRSSDLEVIHLICIHRTTSQLFWSNKISCNTFHLKHKTTTLKQTHFLFIVTLSIFFQFIISIDKKWRTQRLFTCLFISTQKNLQITEMYSIKKIMHSCGTDSRLWQDIFVQWRASRSKTWHQRGLTHFHRVCRLNEDWAAANLSNLTTERRWLN